MIQSQAGGSFLAIRQVNYPQERLDWALSAWYTRRGGGGDEQYEWYPQMSESGYFVTPCGMVFRLKVGKFIHGGSHHQLPLNMSVGVLLSVYVPSGFSKQLILIYPTVIPPF